MRIHLVVNISRIVRYKKLIKKQKVKEAKPVEINKVGKQEIKKILNKIKRIVKYLV